MIDVLETNPDSPNFTEISQVRVGQRWATLGIIGFSGYSLNAGTDTLMASGHVKDKDIVVGDHVGLGNLRGEVTKVYKSSDVETPDLIVGLEVTSDARYLPNDYKDNPADYGYKSPTKIVHTIKLLKDEDPLDSPENLILDGGTTVSAVYNGSIVVFKKQTDDPKTWPKEAQSIHIMHGGSLESAEPDPEPVP